jgi:hypothetical protein
MTFRMGQMYNQLVGSRYDLSPALIQPSVAFSLAFDHVPLDQNKSYEHKA